MNDLIFLVREFQTLITGIFAILAALIAYIAVIHSARYNTQQLARSAAAAYFAELAGIGARLFADIQNLRKTKVRIGNMLPIRELDIGVYDSDPSGVGRLPADEAFMVTNIYKLILDLNGKYERVRASQGFADDYLQHLAGEIEPILKQIAVTLAGLRQTAGIPQDKADAAMGAWTKSA